MMLSVNYILVIHKAQMYLELNKYTLTSAI